MKAGKKGRTTPVVTTRTVSIRKAWRPWLIAAGIAAAALLVYLPAYGGGWSWDDDLSVYANPSVTQPGGLTRIWLTTKDHDFWPLTRTAFRAEYAVFSNNPAGFHTVSILLHAVASVLVYLVLRRLTVPGAALAGLIFAVHPVNAASVAWIAELKTVLALILLAVTVLAWLRFEREQRRALYVAAVLAFAAGLAAKTSIVGWPVMMLGLAWWRRGKVTWRDVVASIPFFVIAGAMAAMTIFVQGRMPTVLMRPLVGLEKVAGAGWVFWFYISKALVPVNLSMIYPHWKDAIGSLGWIAYLPTAGLVALLIVSWLKRGTPWGRGLLAATVYCLLALAPVMGVVSGTITMHSLVADQYQYVPIVGVIAGVCALGSAIVGNHARRRIAAGLVAAVAVVLLGSATLARARVLSSQEEMWKDTLAKNPQSWAAHYNLATGITLQIQRMAPDILNVMRESEIALQRARALEASGDRLGASSYRQRAEAGQRNAEALMREFQARGAEAVSHLRRSLELQPLHIRTYVNLGLVLSSLGQVDEAIGVYRTGIDVEARHYGGSKEPSLWFNLSQALLRRQRYAEAVPVCRTTLQLMPHDRTAVANLVEALNGLAWLQSTSPDPVSRNSPEALASVEEVQRLVPAPDPTTLDVRAAVLADAGRFSDAVAVASSALRMARDQRQDGLAAALASRLQLYEAGQPYRAPQ